MFPVTSNYCQNFVSTSKLYNNRRKIRESAKGYVKLVSRFISSMYFILSVNLKNLIFILKRTHTFGICHYRSFVRSIYAFLGIHSRSKYGVVSRLRCETARLYGLPVIRWGGCDQVRQEAERSATHSATPTFYYKFS